MVLTPETKPPPGGAGGGFRLEIRWLAVRNSAQEADRIGRLEAFLLEIGGKRLCLGLGFGLGFLGGEPASDEERIQILANRAEDVGADAVADADRTEAPR